jgi:gas vesicle protein
MMDVNGLQFGIDVLISILFGATGAIGVWFKLKGKVEIQEVQIKALNTEIDDFKQAKKEMNSALHKRVDTLKEIVERNREKTDASTQEIKNEMNKMELRIITAIHDIGKK